MWSLRQLYPGDNFALALAYCMSGLPDDGWEILRGTMLQSMYGDQNPLPDWEAGKTNLASPGGLSHPNCGIDFNDLTTMFCRAVVEGVFGYQPDYPNEIVRFTPAISSAWDHASIRTPDFEFSFRQRGENDVYAIKLTRPAKISLRVPIRASRVKQVTLNGTALKYKLEPWAGCGMLLVEIPAGDHAEVVIEMQDRQPPAQPITIEKRIGESVDLGEGKIIDLQQCLREHVAAKPGYHMVLASAKSDEVPYWKIFKLHITDPDGDARLSEKILREAPQSANFKCLDLAAVLNGDIRTIFQQKYLSPRPNTCSVRIGYDGYSAWTFPYWNFKPPAIGLDKLSSPLRTPQRAQFDVRQDSKNIAFTSLWDNWPHAVTVPVNSAGDAIWVLVCGSTNPMQGRIANAVIRFRYADGEEEFLELVPPMNFWSLCRFGTADYDYARDAYSLPKVPPPQVQLGENCRAMVYGWNLRPGAILKEVTLETLSQEVVVGLMGVSVMNAR
jgi:hypothetical protein